MNLAENLHKLTPEKRKLVLFALALLAVVVFLMMPSAADLQRAIPEPVRRLYPGDRSPRPVKRSPFDGRPNIAARPLPAPQLPEAAAGLPMPGGLLGTFAGKSLLPRRGICTTSVELRGDAAQTGLVVAYATLQCMDMSILAPRALGAKPMTQEELMGATGRFTPVAFILSGVWESGSIRFHVDKAVGAGDGDGCALESATITAFGARQIAFEGQDRKCGNWQMLLAKAGM